MCERVRLRVRERKRKRKRKRKRESERMSLKCKRGAKNFFSSQAVKTYFQSFQEQPRLIDGGAEGGVYNFCSKIL